MWRRRCGAGANALSPELILEARLLLADRRLDLFPSLEGDAKPCLSPLISAGTEIRKRGQANPTLKAIGTSRDSRAAELC